MFWIYWICKDSATPSTMKATYYVSWQGRKSTHGWSEAGELQQLNLQMNRELYRILVNFSFDFTKICHLLLTLEKATVIMLDYQFFINFEQKKNKQSKTYEHEFQS